MNGYSVAVGLIVEKLNFIPLHSSMLSGGFTYKSWVANVLTVVSVGRAQGADIANLMDDVSVRRLQGAAMANFLADVFVGH